MDFITHLPESNVCTSTWVIVDRFTKMAHFILLRKNQTKGANPAPLFLQNIWRQHIIPTDIVSNRDTQFTSQFWSELARLLGIRQRLSTVFYLQTDGQTERINQVIEHYIRTYSNYEQSNWAEIVTACLRHLGVSLATSTDSHHDQLRHARKCAHVCTVTATNPNRLVIRMFHLFLLLSVVFLGMIHTRRDCPEARMARMARSCI